MSVTIPYTAPSYIDETVYCNTCGRTLAVDTLLLRRYYAHTREKVEWVQYIKPDRQPGMHRVRRVAPGNNRYKSVLPQHLFYPLTIDFKDVQWDPIMLDALDELHFSDVDLVTLDDLLCN